MSSQISSTAATARENARSADGKFGAQPHDRADDVGLDADGGDLVPPPEAAGPEPFLAEGGLDYSSYTTWYTGETDESHIDATVTIPEADLMGFPDGFEPYGNRNVDDPDDDLDEKFERGSVILHQVMEDRYPDVDFQDPSGDVSVAKWGYDLPGRQAQEDMFNTAWDAKGGPVTFANEADPGTFGHEDLSRIFRERAQGAAMTGNPTMYRQDPPALTAEQRARETEARDAWTKASLDLSQQVEIPPADDETARSYATRFATYQSEPLPALQQLAEHGWTDADKARREIQHLEDWAPDDAFQKHQLQQWLTTKQDESATEWVNGEADQ